MTYVVYILLCADSTYYTGCTNHLEKRLKQHNGLKSGAHYTKIRRPVTLVYQEEYQTQTEALKREFEIKRLKHHEKEKLTKTKTL